MKKKGGMTLGLILGSILVIIIIATTYDNNIKPAIDNIFATIGAYVPEDIPGETKLVDINPTSFSYDAKQEVSIKFDVAKEEDVTINIYDTVGGLKKTFDFKDKKPGTYTTKWDGKDKDKKEVPAGIYFIQLKAGDYTSELNKGKVVKLD